MLCHSGNCFSLLSGVHLILFGIVPTAIKRKPHVLLQRLNVGRVDSILFLFQYFPEIVDHNREFASDTKCSPHGRDRRSLWPRPFWALVYAESTRWSVCSRAERRERDGEERGIAAAEGEQSRPSEGAFIRHTDRPASCDRGTYVASKLGAFSSILT